MAADDIMAGLPDLGGRIVGTDGERRAAMWLASRLRGGTGRLGRVRVETFWCHPDWALAAAWHVALALAASLISVGAPKLGGALLIVAIVSVILDAHTGRSPGRLLTPLRATQNVVVTPTAPRSPVTLLITANLDSPRGGLIRRRGAQRLAARLRSLAGPASTGWAGWLVLGMAIVLVTAVARAEGSASGALGALQLVPTVGLVIALALLIDQASAGPAATTDDGALAAAVAIARALAVAPPAHAGVELLLQGAGDGGALGLRHHLRANHLTAPTTVVLALDTSRTDRLGWWFSDGPLVPQRALPILRRHAATASMAIPNRAPAVILGRGTGPALPALQRRIPAVQLGSAPGDTDALVRFALELVDAVDAAIAERAG